MTRVPEWVWNTLRDAGVDLDTVIDMEFDETGGGLRVNYRGRDGLTKITMTVERTTPEPRRSRA